MPAPNCSFFSDHFHGTDFACGAGFVLYRFTTLDGQAVVARDPDHGWGFVPATCAGRPDRVFNDDD